MFSKKIKIVVKIEGMVCEHCASKVKSALEEAFNVKRVKVDLSKKEAVMISSKLIEKSQIKKVIEGLDYKLIDVVEE